MNRNCEDYGDWLLERKRDAALDARLDERPPMRRHDDMAEPGAALALALIGSVCLAALLWLL